MPAELLIPVQTQSCRHVEPVHRVVFILHIEGFRIVRRLATLHTVGSLQPVITPLYARAQTVLGWQGKHSLQMRHCPLLVALQLMLSWIIGEVRRMLTVHIAISQCDGCEIIVIGMTIPIHIQRDNIPYSLLLALCPYIPLATHRGRCVIIAQVIRLHVHTRMLATRSVDTFAIDTPFCIQFHVLGGGIGEPFRHLPVGVAVHGFVARIGDEMLRLVRVFSRCVLPSVAMLQLEIGVTLQFAEVQGNAVVLTQFAV